MQAHGPWPLACMHLSNGCRCHRRKQCEHQRVRVSAVASCRGKRAGALSTPVLGQKRLVHAHGHVQVGDQHPSILIPERPRRGDVAAADLDEEPRDLAHDAGEVLGARVVPACGSAAMLSSCALALAASKAGHVSTCGGRALW